jgi:hypothetical protein
MALGEIFFKCPHIFLNGSRRIQVVGMGHCFGDDSGFGEDQTQCILYK